KGFRKKLLSVLKGIGHDARHPRLLVRHVGYGGEAVGMAWFTPIFSGVGFTAGVIAGDNTPTRNPAQAAFIVGSLGGGVGAVIGEAAIAGAIPATAVEFPVSLVFLGANHLAAGCDVWRNGGEYCDHIDAIDSALTLGAGQKSRKGGSK